MKKLTIQSCLCAFVCFITVTNLVLSAYADESFDEANFLRQNRNFRPLQFGKRDDEFKPLQFGKKDSNFRPLQFGKRASNPMNVFCLSDPRMPPI